MRGFRDSERTAAAGTNAFVGLDCRDAGIRLGLGFRVSRVAQDSQGGLIEIQLCNAGLDGREVDVAGPLEDVEHDTAELTKVTVLEQRDGFGLRRQWHQYAGLDFGPLLLS